MSSIKTAWSYFTKNASEQFIDSLSKEQLSIITNAMKEYAEQFVDLATKEAKTKTSKTMWQGMSDFVEITEVDKESILKIKKLIK